jgi:hypothetical protein
LKINKTILFILFFIICTINSISENLFAQIPFADSVSVKVDTIDSLKNIPPNKLKRPVRKSSLDSTLIDSTKKIHLTKQVVPFTKPLGYKLLLTDSLARWNLTNSTTEFLYWNTGAQHFRTSSFIRSSFALNPAQFEKEWRVDGLVHRNLLGNRLNNNLIPFKRLDQLWLDYLGDFSLQTKRFYLPKPVTILEAEEGDFGYMNVFGSFSAPINKQQSFELSLWNRAEDNEFLNSETQAKNLSLYYRYQLDDFQQLEFHAEYISTQFKEPDGYWVEPISYFTYDRFASRPQRSRARSSLRDARYHIDFIRENKNLFTHSTLFLNLQRRFMKAAEDEEIVYGEINTSPSDTIDWNVRQVGFQTISSINFWGTENSITLTSSLFSSNQQFYKMDLAGGFKDLLWNETELFIRTKTKKWGFDVKTGRMLNFNSINGYSGKTITNFLYATEHQEFMFNYFSKFKQQPFYSRKWQSLTITGKELPTTFHFGGSLGWKKKATNFSIYNELHTSYKTGDYGLKDGTFFVSDPYWSFSMSSEINGSFWKFKANNNLSLTQFVGNNDFWPNQFMVWNRSHLYFEDYFFKKATFIKTGLSLAFSPLSYATPRYQPLLDDWIQPDENQKIPGFVKLDFEFTARVRSLFFYIRWENLTQGILTNGYFETYPYPMFERRLRFGIKTFFID